MFPTRTGQGVVLLVVLLAGLLGGCVGDPGIEDPPEPFGEDPAEDVRYVNRSWTPSAFEAIIGKDVMKWEVQLSGPVDLMMGDGVVVQAYRLDLARPGKHVSTSYFLDGHMRVVTRDQPCLGSRCELFYERDWTQEAALAPYSLSVVYAAHHGTDVNFTQIGVSHQVPLEVESDGELLHVRVLWPSSGFSSSYPGILSVAQNDTLPADWMAGAEMYREGPRLPAIPPLPAPAEEQKTGDTGTPIADADAVWENGTSPQRMLDAVADAVEKAGGRVDCLTLMMLEAPQQRKAVGGLEPPVPVLGYHQHAWIRIKTDEGISEDWNVHYTKEFHGPETFEAVLDKKHAKGNQAYCRLAEKEQSSTIPWKVFMEEAQRLQPSSGGVETFLLETYECLKTCDAFVPDFRYAAFFDFSPHRGFMGGAQWSLRMDSSTGALLSMIGPEEDVLTARSRLA